MLSKQLYHLKMRIEDILERYKRVHQEVLQQGVVIKHAQFGHTVFDRDLVSPHLIILYCRQGSSRMLYNMGEVTISKNTLAVIMPNHVVNGFECSDNFDFTFIMVSSELFAEMRKHSYNYDYDIFHLSPTCQLPDEREKYLMKIFDLLNDIVTFNAEDDLQLRHQVLLTQLSVCFEFIHYHFRVQKKKRSVSPNAELFTSFCKLVVENYRESREVKYYASLLNLTPKYFAKLIRQETGGLSPTEWIERYVIAQAKQLIENNPTRSLGQIAYMLGFSEATSFYRYFKRVSGITAKQYREDLRDGTR